MNARKLSLCFLPLALCFMAACGPKDRTQVAKPEKAVSEALYHAVENGDVATARALIEKGEVISPCRFLGGSLASIAASKGSIEMLKLLAEKGANLDELNSQTPLYSAAWACQLEAVRFLLDRGADPNGQEKVRPLLAAVECGNIPMMQLLIDRGAKLYKYGACDPVPLVSAAHKRDIGVVEFFLDRGTPVDASDCEGITALMIASKNGSVEMAKLLLSKGANSTAKAFHGETAMQFAVDAKRYEIVQMLLDDQDARLQRGLQPTMTNSNGETVSYAPLPLPFFEGAKIGRTDWVRRALAAGVGVDSRDYYGYTALIVASEYGHSDIVRILLDAKANPNLVSDYGVTALDAALRRHDAATIGMLKAAGGKAGLPMPRFVGSERSRNSNP
jgi:ankyrin repeat protein